MPSSEKQSDIMRAFVMLCTSYKQADKKRTRRLKLDEVRQRIRGKRMRGKREKERERERERESEGEREKQRVCVCVCV